MENRVFGLVGIKSKMANWNSDFTSMPRTLSSGKIFASQQTIKYQIRKRLNDLYEDEQIFSRKTYRESAGTMVPQSLEERFYDLFNLDTKEKLTSMDAQKLLLSCLDVKLFGLTFAIKKLNFGLQGVVQFGDAMNIDDQATIESVQIMSPWRNPSEKVVKKEDEIIRQERGATTLGERFITDEAHYLYPFSISPHNLDIYAEQELTEGFTESDYAKFTKAVLSCGQASPSSSKGNCLTEVAVFIEGDETLALPPLDSMVSFIRKGGGNGKNQFTFDLSILHGIEDRIRSIDIYSNILDSEFVLLNDETINDRIKMKNIIAYC